MACPTPILNLPPGRPLNLVLLGKTGHGKSATGNCIFGKKIFTSRMSTSSVTHKCQLESGSVGGRMINLVDTPGTMNFDNPDATLKEIGTSIAYCSEGFHGFLLVLRPDVRMTDEEWMSITLLKRLFGKEVLKRFTMLVFTHGDAFESADDRNGKSFPEWLRCQGPEFRKLLDECNMRYFLINNREQNPGTMGKQIIELISLIDRLVKENNQQMYTDDLFQIAKEELKKEEDKIKEDEERLNCLKRTNHSKKDVEDAQNAIDKRVQNKHEHAGEKVAEVAKKSGRACFPPDALVKLEDGKIIAMADLHVGHKVLSSVSNAKLEYSEVYFFAHLDPWKQNQYICICASKYKLKLTPDHHIFIVGNRNTVDTVSAEKINIGDSVLIFDEATYSIQAETVTHLSRSTEVGIYAPITMSGTIIVDNVLVSCYVNTVPPKIVHSLLWPMRTLYQLSPSFSAWVNVAGKEGMPIWARLIIDSFLRWRK